MWLWLIDWENKIEKDWEMTSGWNQTFMVWTLLLPTVPQATLVSKIHALTEHNLSPRHNETQLAGKAVSARIHQSQTHDLSRHQYRQVERRQVFRQKDTSRCQQITRQTFRIGICCSRQWNRTAIWLCVVTNEKSSSSIVLKWRTDYNPVNRKKIYSSPILLSDAVPECKCTLWEYHFIV